ncbi:MAG TPA: Sec-independent protein translocase subunit TatA [Plantibacter sp.]|uniref:Sec-independent protein translocase subunit TatA n=1 Tax=unclassified Plantibacter TaxID=2624265 RepID=UPI002C204368|nr:Sec-independent protein translocase subunit TatA [Plantibacter sp.]
MFGNAFSGWHLVIILVIVLLLFGAPKLPGLARSVGQSMRIFKSEVKSMKSESEERSEPQPETVERVPADPGSPAARSHDA